MARWSGMKAKLEKDYLAESLRGHIQYFVTNYRKIVNRSEKSYGSRVIQEPI